MSEKVRGEVHHYVREWFDLDNDLRPFYEMAKKITYYIMQWMSFMGFVILGFQIYLKQ